MKRRDFLASVATAAAPLIATPRPGLCVDSEPDSRTFATPAEAAKSPPEMLAYVAAIYEGTGIRKPDYLATIDVDPKSETYSRVVHRLPMPNVGDELHHFGWDACASCHGVRGRRYLILPGLLSGRIHIVDTLDRRRPKLYKVIEPDEIRSKARLSGPHTVHCLADGRVMISMLGDEAGNAPGGFLLLDDRFDVAGRWEAGLDGMNYNYDFWYQPRHNVMVSSEWAAPKTFREGFKPADVAAGKYGRRLHFWDWQERKISQTIDLGEDGQIPLEVRFHHDPASTHGFVGAALSSTVWHWHKVGGRWDARKVISVPAEVVKGSKDPVPGLITDLVLSLDDRWLYLSNWLHGDVRQYDVTDPAKPRLAAQLWLGGMLGRPSDAKASLTGGPQMLQLSLDGKRLYVTNSLFSRWDNQFYPQIAEKGSYMLRVDCDTKSGGMSLDERFLVDFGKEPEGPARAHEVRFPYGDSTSDIWA
ncbi:selenium-binding family protein [Isosphaeraceae bacterium EP7]